LHVAACLAGLLAPRPALAGDVTQADINALERDLSHIGEGEARDNLLAMLMEGLVERCFPEDAADANPVVRDEFSLGCLERVIEVAAEIEGKPEHPDRARALFVSGKASIALQRPQAGGELLRRFVEEYPDADEAPLAHFSLAELAVEAGDDLVAFEHYCLAAEGLDGDRQAAVLYRMAWCLHRSGRGGGSAVLAKLLTDVEELDDATRQTARADLVVMLVSEADHEATLSVAKAIAGDGAPAFAASVAEAHMSAGRHDAATHHYVAMLLCWPDHADASSWQVACIDAAIAREAWSDVVQAVRVLMKQYGPGPSAGADVRDLQVEETSRSTIARLHQRSSDTGSPERGVVEELYRIYLECFPWASKASEVHLALAALLQEDGRPLDAVDEMLAVAEAQGGREIGAQAARLSVPLIQQGRAGEEGAAYEDRLLRLAELFADRYPRHSDGVEYAREAGRILIGRGELEPGCRVLVEGATRLPASAEARQCAAIAMEALVAVEAWPQVVDVATQLLQHRQLMAAHADLAGVLSRAQAAARFNLAVQVWESGDPASAVPMFEQIATEAPGSDVAPGALVNAALCMQESGNGARSAMILRRVYTGYPDSEMALIALEQEAYLRFEADEFTRAAGLFQQLATQFPQHENAPYALYTAGALYDQEGVFDRAIECYESFLATYPDAPETADARPRLEELKASE